MTVVAATTIHKLDQAVRSTVGRQQQFDIQTSRPCLKCWGSPDSCELPDNQLLHTYQAGNTRCLGWYKVRTCSVVETTAVSHPNYSYTPVLLCFKLLKNLLFLLLLLLFPSSLLFQQFLLLFPFPLFFFLPFLQPISPPLFLALHFSLCQALLAFLLQHLLKFFQLFLCTFI